MAIESILSKMSNIHLLLYMEWKEFTETFKSCYMQGC